MTSDPTGGPGEPSAESIRRANLQRESAIRSVGQLCQIVAFFSVLGTVEFALFAWKILPRDEFKNLAPASVLDAGFWFFSAVFAFNAVAQVALGVGLIRLRPWARWTVVVLTAASLVFGTMSSLILIVGGSSFDLFTPLLGFELNGKLIGLASLLVGGVFHLLILWPMVASGAGLVFSDGYREIIRQTPEIRPRMHWLLKVFLAGLMMLVVGFIAYLLAIYLRIID